MGGFVSPCGALPAPGSSCVSVHVCVHVHVCVYAYVCMPCARVCVHCMCTCVSAWVCVHGHTGRGKVTDWSRV